MNHGKIQKGRLVFIVRWLLGIAKLRLSLLRGGNKMKLVIQSTDSCDQIEGLLGVVKEAIVRRLQCENTGCDN